MTFVVGKPAPSSQRLKQPGQYASSLGYRGNCYTELPSSSLVVAIVIISSSAEALCPTQHIIGHFGDDFYRPNDQTNSVKALNETSWLSRSGLNCTRTTPPCYNNTTLGRCLYAQRKGSNVTNPICWSCKNCSHKCAADCEHCVTQSSPEQF